MRQVVAIKRVSPIPDMTHCIVSTASFSVPVRVVRCLFGFLPLSQPLAVTALPLTTLAISIRYIYLYIYARPGSILPIPLDPDSVLQRDMTNLRSNLTHCDTPPSGLGESQTPFVAGVSAIACYHGWTYLTALAAVESTLEGCPRG